MTVKVQIETDGAKKTVAIPNSAAADDKLVAFSRAYVGFIEDGVLTAASKIVTTPLNVAG